MSNRILLFLDPGFILQGLLNYIQWLPIQSEPRQSMGDQRDMGALEKWVIWASDRVVILYSFQPTFLKLFGLGHGWRALMRARNQTAGNFGETFSRVET